MKQELICLALILNAAAAFADARPEWAFPFASAVQPPSHDDGTPKSVPGGKAKFTQTQISDLSNTADWYPDQHPPMPRPVAHGEGAALACGACHLTSGMGHPESSHLAGQPAAYMVEQLADFKSGVRKEPARMNSISRALSDDDARIASEWFAAIKPRRWFKVVEATEVPKSYGNEGRMRLPLPEGGKEPLGSRIVELPQNATLASQRDPNSGFVTYVPVGSIAKGKTFVTTGGGKTQPCTSCHGAKLTGVGNVPGIAGGSSLYLARQLYHFKTGDRAAHPPP